MTHLVLKNVMILQKFHTKIGKSIHSAEILIGSEVFMIKDVYIFGPEKCTQYRRGFVSCRKTYRADEFFSTVPGLTLYIVTN